MRRVGKFLAVVVGISCLFVDVHGLFSRGLLTKDGNFPGAEELSILIQTLERSPTGRKEIVKAKKFWNVPQDQELLSFLKWSDVSRTDAVLVRHYDPELGIETRDRKVMIYLRKDQNLEDATLDLAHELVHATTRPHWDPYDPGLTRGKYIWNSLEAKGGEVEALWTECQVGLELGRVFPRCRRFLNKDGNAIMISKAKILRDFYRVGDWKGQVQRRLAGEVELFPMLSGDSPELFSSTGNAPYPFALLVEFDQMNETACKNSRSRLRTLGKHHSSAASTQTFNPLLQEAGEFVHRRCK